jgi:hypothetical protein
MGQFAMELGKKLGSSGKFWEKTGKFWGKRKGLEVLR